MPCYLVKLDFKIAFAECDETPGRTAPGTPEELLLIDPELLLVCKGQEPDERKTRTYHCELILPGENDGAAAQAVVNMFKHLPRFEVVAVATEPIESPTATDPVSIHKVRILFESDVPWMTLSRAFQTVSPLVSLAPAGSAGNQYMAHCYVESVGPDEAIEGLRRDCKECCGATDDPATDLNYREKEALTELTATPATKEYAVVCRFRSTEPFLRLSDGFDANVAKGAFFRAPQKPGYYVAYVVMHAPSSDGLEKAVEDLLTTAFDAHDGQKTNRFAEVTTNLL